MHFFSFLVLVYLIFQPVGGDTGSEHDRDNVRGGGSIQKVTTWRLRTTPLQILEHLEERPFSQFGRVGGSQWRSDPQESRWEVPATVTSCKVNIEVRVKNGSKASTSLRRYIPPDLSDTLHISAHRARWKMPCSITLELRDAPGAFHCSLSAPEMNKSTTKDILLPRNPTPLIWNVSLHLWLVWKCGQKGGGVGRGGISSQGWIFFYFFF